MVQAGGCSPLSACFITTNLVERQKCHFRGMCLGILVTLLSFRVRERAEEVQREGREVGGEKETEKSVEKRNASF